MKKLLAVYNICQLGNANGTPYYIDCIRALLSQTLKDTMGDDFQIAISGCWVLDGTKVQLTEYFKNHISYNFVEERLPLSITFNDTVDKCVQEFGEFDGYLYIDSGISFWDPSVNYDALQKLWDVYKSGPYAICAAMPSNDDGSPWWGLKYEQGQDFIFPVGKTTNMHCQIFSNEWRKAYGRILPDIFASNCMESVFSHMTAAMHKKFIITQKVHVQHLHSLDGASIGSREVDPDRHPMTNTFTTGGLFYKRSRTIDEMYRDGQEFGFGIEECAEYWKHDPTKFDDNGAKDERLLPFYKKEMYLNQEEFDYSKIKYIWVPAGE